MSREIATQENLELAYFFMQPTRQKIIETIQGSNKPMYVGDIALGIGHDRKNVITHLERMRVRGLVDREYRVEKDALGIVKRGYFYWPTPEVDRAYSLTVMLLELLVPKESVI